MNQDELNKIFNALKMGHNTQKNYYFREIMLPPLTGQTTEQSKHILYARHNQNKKQTNFWTLPELPRETIEANIGEVILYRAHEAGLINIHEIDVTQPNTITLKGTTHEAKISDSPPKEGQDGGAPQREEEKEGERGYGGEREEGERREPAQGVLGKKSNPLILKEGDMMMLEMTNEYILYIVNEAESHNLQIKKALFTSTTKTNVNLDRWIT